MCTPGCTQRSAIVVESGRGRGRRPPRRRRPDDPGLALGLGRRRGREADGSGRRPARPRRHGQGLGGRLLGGENRRPPRLRRPRQPGRRHRRGRAAANRGRLADPRAGHHPAARGHPRRSQPGGVDPSRRPRHLVDRRPALAPRRRRAPSHPRPAHRPARRPGLADGLGRRRDLRRRQHRGHRRDHQGRPRAGVAGRPQPPRPPGIPRRRAFAPSPAGPSRSAPTYRSDAR